MRKEWLTKLRSIMTTAWALFRRGIVTMSMSLKVAWRVVRGEIALDKVYKQLKRG
ncbi:hypothetical protein [Larkinella terrae]|uniref:Uncharacterized protein n=1 Tax=Larkinella terrae TaxID=2025311 RepID=A0A7K0EK96_9BACT|nr:hypothetical protein [Larkinella terrae]MRS61896.1 hypothetical protein [Larkinella terrae]